MHNLGNDRQTLQAVIGEKRADILRLASHFGAVNVRVFGSVARGEATDASDIDLLVSFPNPYKLRDLIRLTQALQAVVGRRVEVVDEAMLREEIRAGILKDAEPL